MKPKGIEHDRKRTKYACFKVCRESEQMLPLCNYLKEQSRMEQTNFYKGIDNVTIHVVEHDIVLTQDIIFDFLTTGKKSPVLNLNY